MREPLQMRLWPVWLATRNAVTVDRGRHSVRYARKAATS